jgi:hypothetical protein
MPTTHFNHLHEYADICLLTTSFVYYFRSQDDYCGRWKNTHRQQETYEDTEVRYVDAKVAAALCKGGPIAYVVDRLGGPPKCWGEQFFGEPLVCQERTVLLTQFVASSWMGYMSWDLPTLCQRMGPVQ